MKPLRIKAIDYADLVKPKKKSKYGNNRVEYDGEWFDSNAELNWWLGKQLEERMGEISELKRQTAFELRGINGNFICNYRCDGEWIDNKTNKRVVADVKGFATQEYKLKRKLFEDNYPDYIFIEVQA